MIVIRCQTLLLSPSRIQTSGSSFLASGSAVRITMERASGNTTRVRLSRSRETGPPLTRRLSIARPKGPNNSDSYSIKSNKLCPDSPEKPQSPRLNDTSEFKEDTVKETEKFQNAFHKQKIQRKLNKYFGKRKARIPLKSSRKWQEAETNHSVHDRNQDYAPSADLGPYLLELAKSTIASGDNPQKALDFVIRAAKVFQKIADGKPSLELVMSLHILAAIHCILGEFEEAVPVLEHSITVPDVEAGGLRHALATFAGYMQLGDTLALLGRGEDALAAYHTGLDVQKRALGDMDPRVGETCRYLAEAHLQVLQFKEAEELCQQALEIHKLHSRPASVEEATDRRLMGLIHHGKGEYEAALEDFVLASMALIANGLDADVAEVDGSIGDVYVCLQRFDEALFAYQKALTVFKSAKGEDHTSVASIYVSLADVNLKTGKRRECKTYCESALRIYRQQQGAATQLNDIATGLTDIAAVYEALNEQEHALQLLQRALRILEAAPGQQSAAAGIEAQIGVIYYMKGKYSHARSAFQNAVSKLRGGAERKSSLLGIVLNQMGLACAQLCMVEEAARLFEDASYILRGSCGPEHANTLAVYSNLAGTYDALGRLDDAIGVLEYVVETREEKVGTATVEVEEERRRLAELLKEGGRAERTYQRNFAIAVLAV